MDRITRVRVENVRAIESFDLTLQAPMTVLIGENGSGKSTLLECLEILRLSTESSFLQSFYRQHRGMPGVLRAGAHSLRLGVVIEDRGGDRDPRPALEYTLELGADGANTVISAERLVELPSGREVLVLQGREAVYWDGAADAAARASAAPSQLTALAQFGRGRSGSSLERALNALSAIEVHLGFQTLASWAARAYRLPETLRMPQIHFPAARLDLLGTNLANAWSELRSGRSENWDRAMALVRLGLGDRIDNVVVKPDPGGGNVYLAVSVVGLPTPIMAGNLSDGQLAWLAFVAMTRLNPGRSILAIDEPELHLHPHLLGGVVALLQQVDAPVLVATHADRLLEQLDDPARSVRVCTLDDQGRAGLAALDPVELPRWLEQFGDLGQIRSAGYLERVLQVRPDADDAA
ncbi:MAG: AAA family ATPase [Myxococcales bacterium]|nr:AAA family ATPase [Myxococcales bacterium]